MPAKNSAFHWSADTLRTGRLKPGKRGCRGVQRYARRSIRGGQRVANGSTQRQMTVQKTTLPAMTSTWNTSW